MTIANFNIVGNLCRDAETRRTPAGYPIATFSVAVNRRKRNRETDEWEEEASFFRCKLLGDRAERIAPMLTKGKKVAVSGTLSQSRWEDANGEKKSSYDFIANDVEFMSPPRQSAPSDDEIPF